MAKATKIIHKQETNPETKHEREKKEFEKQLLKHQDSLSSLLSILDKTKDHEILNMLNAGLEESDQIIHRIVTAIQETDASKSIKNLLLIVQLLGVLDMEELEPLVIKFNKGVEIAGKYEHKYKRSGYLSLLAALKDSEVIEGTNILLRMVKGLGTDVSEMKKTGYQTGEDEDKEKQIRTNQEANKSKPSKWHIFIGGGVILLGSVLFKKSPAIKCKLNSHLT